MRALVLLFVLLAGPVSAGCAEERRFVLDALERNDWRVESMGRAGDGFERCSLSRLVLVEDTMRVEVARVDWALDGVEALATGRGNVELSVTVDGARITAQTADPWVDYMLRQQNLRNRIDAALELQWDLDRGALRVTEANVSFPGENSLSLSSAVEGLGPEVLQGRSGALLGLSVRSLDLSVENSGFLDGLILGAVIGQFSTVAGAPETVVSATQVEAKEIVEAWPEDVVDAASKAALSDLIDAAPVPWGRASLVIDAGDGLPLSRFLSPVVLGDPASPEAIAAAFDGVEVRFRFEPADDGG